MPLTLRVLPGLLAVCRLEANAALPNWATSGRFWSLTRTTDELSVVCDQGLVPPGVLAELGWRALQVVGPLDFSLTGILAGISGALADSGISLFAISTYDTDTVLVKSDSLTAALQALSDDGYTITSVQVRD